MVYGGYGGYGGWGGYGGYGGVGTTPSVASGIYPPGSAPGSDEYVGGGSHGDKPKGFLQGLFSGAWDGVRKMFTTVPGVLTTLGAVGLTVATGGAALIPLGAVAAGAGIFNAGKGLVNQDGQGFTKGLLLGLGGLLAIRYAPSKIMLNGRSFLLGGDASKPLDFMGRLKTLWGGNHYVDSKGNASNWLAMCTDKIVSQFRPNQASLEHLKNLKAQAADGAEKLSHHLDAEDALRAGFVKEDEVKAVKDFLRTDRKDVADLKSLRRQFEQAQLNGKPTDTLSQDIIELEAKRNSNYPGNPAFYSGGTSIGSSASSVASSSSEGTRAVRVTGNAQAHPSSDSQLTSETLAEHATSQPLGRSVADLIPDAPASVTKAEVVHGASVSRPPNSQAGSVQIQPERPQGEGADRLFSTPSSAVTGPAPATSGLGSASPIPPAWEATFPDSPARGVGAEIPSRVSHGRVQRAESIHSDWDSMSSSSLLPPGESSGPVGETTRPWQERARGVKQWLNRALGRKEKLPRGNAGQAYRFQRLSE